MSRYVEITKDGDEYQVNTNYTPSGGSKTMYAFTSAEGTVFLTSLEVGEHTLYDTTNSKPITAISNFYYDGSDSFEYYNYDWYRDAENDVVIE